SARQLMSGGWLESLPALAGRERRVRVAAVLCAAFAFLLVTAAALEWIPSAAGFFGSGTLLLIASLCALAIWLRNTSTTAFAALAAAALRRSQRAIPARAKRALDRAHRVGDFSHRVRGRVQAGRDRSIRARLRLRRLSADRRVARAVDARSGHARRP